MKNTYLKYYLIALIIAGFTLLCNVNFVHAQFVETPEESCQSIFTKYGYGKVNSCDWIQEKEGRIWIGTAIGLFNYDGIHLNKIQLQTPGIHLEQNGIKFIRHAEAHCFWIVNESNQLIHYNYWTQTTSLISGDKYAPVRLQGDSIRAIDVDIANNVWIATNEGLNKISGSDKNYKIKYYLPAPYGGSLPQAEINDIKYQKGNLLWIATQNGLLFFDINQNQFVFHPEIQNVNDGLSIINQIEIDSYGRIVVLSNSNELWVKTDKEKTANFIKLYKEVNEGGYKITKITLDNFGIWYHVEQSQEITHIAYNLQRKKFKTGEASIIPNAIKCDISGNIWGLHQDGLCLIANSNSINKIDLRLSPFNLTEPIWINNLVEDEQGNLWIATENYGLQCYRRNGNQLLHYGINEQGQFHLAENKIKSITQSKTKIYINSEHTIYAIDKLTRIPELIFSNNGGFISTICFDEKRNSIWIGGIQSLKQLNLINNTQTEYPNLLSLENKISEDNNCIFISTFDDKLWVGSNQGIKVSNAGNGNFIYLKSQPNNLNSIGSNLVNCFAEDTNGVWIGTKDAGISLYQKRTNAIIRINTANLSGLEICAIYPSKDGHLWLSTNKGIYKYNIKTNECNEFGSIYGLKNFSFNPNSFYVAKSGYTYWGGHNSIVCFHPDSIETKYLKALTSIQKVSVNGEQIMLSAIDSLTSSIQLGYKNSNFAIDILAIDFVNGPNIQYAYILEGWNRDWVYCGNNHHIEFNKVSPGTYIFKFKVSNGDGEWVESGQQLIVIIKAPYYKTWWFIALIISLTVVASYYIYKIIYNKFSKEKKAAVDFESLKMKQSFLANMSHEMRTPMNAVVGFSELLAKTELNDQQNGYVNAIKNASSNLLLLINDILDYSKLESGKMELNEHPFNLKESIHKLFTILEIKAQEKNLRLISNVDPAIDNIIIGDEIKLNQILTNLIGNAIKFTHIGYVALDVKLIESSDTELKVRIVVSDTGIGISVEKIENIFESFTRASSDSSKLYGGTGLGLSITKQMTELMGGNIYVKSELNQGTEFILDFNFKRTPRFSSATTIDKIPEVKQDEATITTTPAAILTNNQKDSESGTTTSTNNKKRILIVEDNKFNQLLAQNVVQKHFPDIELVMAENGAMALEKLSQQKFDLVLMDIQMPIMGGIDAAKAIRASQGDLPRDIPIIACTAGVTPHEIQECYDAGMNDFVGKPYKPEEMAIKIKNYLP